MSSKCAICRSKNDVSKCNCGNFYCSKHIDAKTHNCYELRAPIYEEFRAMEQMVENLKTITFEDIEKVYNFFKKYPEEDPEVSHMIEDSLKNKVFELFASDKLLKKEMIEISELMVKISKLPFDRWYA